MPCDQRLAAELAAETEVIDGSLGNAMKGALLGQFRATLLSFCAVYFGQFYEAP